MSRSGWGRSLVFAIFLLAGATARADLYEATKAYESKDFARAFELFRELAELGNPTAQETIAVMYVNAEGVPRDNVMGYAWAVIAGEHGASDAMQGIKDQLEPHMNAATHARAAEVRAKFGMAALNESLLPAPLDGDQQPAPFKPGEWCTVNRPVNPDDYFPDGAISRGISGYVLVEVTVMPDGRAHNPRVLESVPRGVFDEPGRRVAFDSGYRPRKVDGAKVPCKLRFKIKFALHMNGSVLSVPGRIADDSDKTFELAKSQAQAGDPLGQWLYALLLEQRPKDPDRDHARDWIVKAAQAGVADAQYEIGSRLARSSQKDERESKKGIAWLERAAAAGQVDAQVALAADALSGHPTVEACDRAQTLLDQPGALGTRDGKLYLAALLAAGPDVARHDPRRAIKLLDGIASEVDSDPTSFEIRAAAHAQLGELEDAKREQQRALAKAGKIGWDLAPLNERMASYEAGRSWTGILFPF